MSRTIRQNAPNIAAGPSTAATSTLDRLSRRVVVGLLCTMAGLAAAGTGGAFLLKPGTAQAGRMVGDTLRTAANYARLPAMIFTLSDGDRLRELRVRVVLDMEPTAPAKTVESYGPRIASAMTNVMLETDPGELRGRNGAFYIKDAVMRTAAKELGAMKIRQVLVQELVMR
ncbi:flagellar basal body-associated FliL family protein [Azospirillum aestuarii]|uniref:flagellar basal body-associated FliL family protein n=1 Tax=Azospirillum aestuarii TaxID=2802052 RepID=UPI004054FCDB